MITELNLLKKLKIADSGKKVLAVLSNKRGEHVNYVNTCTYCPTIPLRCSISTGV